MNDDQLQCLIDTLGLVMPLAEKYGMEDDDWLSLVAELAAAKMPPVPPPRGPTLLTGSLTSTTSSTMNKDRAGGADDASSGVHAEVERALAEYMAKKHDGESLKELLVTVVTVIRAHHYHTAPDDAGGLRQRKLGAVVEAALAYSRRQGRPSRQPELIDHIVTTWEELIERGEATPDRCPRRKIVQRLAGKVDLSEDQVAAAMRSPEGQAAKKTLLIDRPDIE